MIKRFSLRLRLFVVIIVPLVIMAALLGFWRFHVAQKTAEDLFDRSLLVAALAISRDVAISEGDALSHTTRTTIREASGGEVFYHATGPNGIYVTGYGYPPAILPSLQNARNTPVFAQAAYRGEEVRVLKLSERVNIDGLSGTAVVTVWQRLSDRQAFARELAVRAVALIGALLVTLAVVIWFGVAVGLRPLLDLQDAISIRSPDDLSEIRRPVPAEVQGILETLNRLFRHVERSMHTHQTFISDAAHQLRNPAAAVQSMAEAAREAKTEADRQERLDQLVDAARSSARVAEQLLSLDRLRQSTAPARFETFELNRLIAEICADEGPRILSQGIDFSLDIYKTDIVINADRIVVAEAVKNLINNSLAHGGPDMRAICVKTSVRDSKAKITVADDGKGLTPDQSDVVFRRFSQVEPSAGSGLGLAIVASVAERHGGRIDIDDCAAGASLTLSLPLRRRD